MRKIIGIITIMLIPIVILYIYFFVSENRYYKTVDYYIVIHSSPEVGYEQDDRGNKIKTYNYKITGYNKGNSRKLDLQLRNQLNKKLCISNKMGGP